jgi:hypothetical protein
MVEPEEEDAAEQNNNTAEGPIVFFQVQGWHKQGFWPSNGKREANSIF